MARGGWLARDQLDRTGLGFSQEFRSHRTGHHEARRHIARWRDRGHLARTQATDLLRRSRRAKGRPATFQRGELLARGVRFGGVRAWDRAVGACLRAIYASGRRGLKSPGLVLSVRQDCGFSFQTLSSPVEAWLRTPLSVRISSVDATISLRGKTSVSWARPWKSTTMCSAFASRRSSTR